MKKEQETTTTTFGILQPGDSFVTKDGEFRKTGRTTALFVFSPTFAMHEGKHTCGWRVNSKVIRKLNN